MKKTLVFGWLLLLLCGVIALFWRNEWVYAKPTPVPEHYKPVTKGSPVNLPAPVKALAQHKPLFLHFFNPDCPCSRFNVPYFATLVRKYNSQASFAVVVMSRKHFSAQEILDKFHVSVPVINDSTLALVCGVYSTPQAVIIDKNNTLYYRGNYNKSRYCQDDKTAYAETALNALLLHSPNGYTPDSNALRAYGCELPNCTRK